MIRTRRILSRVLTVAAVAAVLVPMAPQTAEAQVNPGVIGRKPMLRVAPPMMPTDTRTPATADAPAPRVLR